MHSFQEQSIVLLAESLTLMPCPVPRFDRFMIMGLVGHIKILELVIAVTHFCVSDDVCTTLPLCWCIIHFHAYRYVVLPVQSTYCTYTCRSKVLISWVWLVWGHFCYSLGFLTAYIPLFLPVNSTFIFVYRYRLQIWWINSSAHCHMAAVLDTSMDHISISFPFIIKPSNLLMEIVSLSHIFSVSKSASTFFATSLNANASIIELCQPKLFFIDVTAAKMGCDNTSVTHR